MLRLVLDSTYRRWALAQVDACREQARVFTTNPIALPWRSAALLVVLPALLFLLSQSRPILSGDSRPVTLTATCLLREGTCELSTFEPIYAAMGSYQHHGLPYFLKRTRTGIHAAYPSGLVPLALPPTVLAWALGAPLADPGAQDRLEKLIASGLAALCLGLFYLLALHLTDAGSAWLVTALLATGSALCTTVGQALWQQDGVIFWLLTALLVEFRTARGPLRQGSLMQGIALAMMLACRLSAVLLIVPFAGSVLLRAPRRALAVAGFTVLAYLPWAWFYTTIYGTPFGPAAGQLEEFVLAWPTARVFQGVFLAPDHGLLPYQPWLLLGLAGCLPLLVRPQAPESGHLLPRDWAVCCAAGIVLHLTMICLWWCWWGGHCWGSRLAAEVVPLAGLLCLAPIAALRQVRLGRGLIAAVALLGLFLHGTGVYRSSDYRDVQPGLFSRQLEPPGSWHNLPFLSSFRSAS